MNHSVCIYVNKDAATQAAALARRRGAPAHVSVQSVDDGSDESASLFILKSEMTAQQKVIDTIAEASGRVPELADEVVHCPSCGSILVNCPGHYEISPSVRGFSRFLNWLGRKLQFAKPPELSCRKCGHQWKASRAFSPKG